MKEFLSDPLKWLWKALAFLGAVYLAGAGGHMAARNFVVNVSAESLGPRITSVESIAKLNMEWIDRRFNTLEIAAYGKVITPPREPASEESGVVNK